MEPPACTPDEWQAEISTRLADMQEQLGRMETQAISTDGRVSGLEDRMDVADRERLSLTATVEIGLRNTGATRSV